MILATILNSEKIERLVLVIDNKFADLQNEASKLNISLPSNMSDFLNLEEDGMNKDI